MVACVVKEARLPFTGVGEDGEASRCTALYGDFRATSRRARSRALLHRSEPMWLTTGRPVLAVLGPSTILWGNS